MGSFATLAFGAFQCGFLSMIRCLAWLLLFGFAYGAPNGDAFPQPASIKGLQVQMTEDALALGIHHAAININVSAVSDAYLAALDRQIRPLSEKGVVVYAILIAYPGGDEGVMHPAARGGKGYTVAGFEAGERLREVCEMMAKRWSGAHPEHGRVWGWIVGNEVNSHGMWYHVGRQPPAGVVDAYERAFRIVHGAVRQASANARLYVPFDHHWTARMGKDDELAMPGRDFLDAFAALARKRGDLDWHLAWHPYPANLGKPRI
jgi:hypothetical protein